ncbi:MAG: hypothetical protein O2862_01705 [Bacteroidetes bacterium]|nr:hypothetical protein [Bacteroidota bacterium]MDA0851602.1 hypothetical protein [Pseudomonadota bacterium]
MENTQNLIIIGAGHALTEVCDIISDINQLNSSKRYDVIGILDDNLSLKGKMINDLPVLGSLSCASELAENDPSIKFIFAIGSITTRTKRELIFRRLKLTPDNFETLIHPSAIISSSAVIGYGCIIHAFVSIGANSILGDFVIIAVRSTLGLFVDVGNFCMICSHILILTGVKFAPMVFVGSGSLIQENLVLEDACVVGVNSLVTKSVKKKTWVIGNPARIFQKDS